MLVTFREISWAYNFDLLVDIPFDIICVNFLLKATFFVRYEEFGTVRIRKPSF